MNYIIFDLEATCWEEKHQHTSEIIEIGAVKINDNQQIVDEFCEFVQPILQPQLSEFCKKLTSIQQTDVDNADKFPLIIEDFKNWIGVGKQDYVLCSWGFYDKKQLKQDAELHNLTIDWVNKHISVKHQHQKLCNLKKAVGLGRAIHLENMQFEGTAHRGIDDARNIAKIFVKYFKKWKI